MHLRSQREFIAALESAGEIQRIDTEVDWNLEIGAIIRRSYDLRAPAPLFTSITGYQGTGFAVLGAPASLSGAAHPLARIALSVGLPATASGQDIIETLVAARDKPGIAPVPVARASAPCKQNLQTGDDIEAHSFLAGKVIHNCLLGDRFPAGQRPVKGTLANGWPAEIQQRVLARWHAYGYR